MAGQLNLRFHALLWLATILPSTAAADLVTVPLTDGTSLRAHWFPVAANAPRPAIISLHGCGGLYGRDGTTLDARYPEYVERFHTAGYHVVLPDSLGSRGVRSLCATPSAERTIKVETRRGDVLATLRWVTAQPQVDPARIALLGWSHGASTALASINTARAGAASPLAAAVVLYPACRDFLRRTFAIGEPLLMLLGAKDDWTPPGPCLELAEATRAQQPGAEFEVRVYEESAHGFDSARPVRFWKGIPNGTDPVGVHVGGNPAARAAAFTEIDTFLRRHLEK